jgi:hypothetical protein
MNRVLAVAFLTLALAGCSEDPSSAVPVEPVVSGETGMIRGVVLGTTVTPIVGANVTIDGYSVLAITNADGAFAFEGLAAGSYFLNAQHPDFFAGKASTQVVAGAADPPIVKFSLQPQLKFTPFAEPFEFKGFLQCSYRFLLVANNCPGGNSEVTYPISIVPEWVQSQLQWASGSPAGDALSFDFTVPGTTVDYLEAEGVSPLTIMAPPEEIKKNGLGSGLDLYLRVFTSDAPGTGTGLVPFGVGFQLDQEFTIYTHIFYGFQPFDGWTFLEHGVPTP